MSIPDFTKTVEVSLSLSPKIHRFYQKFEKIAQEEGHAVSQDSLIVLAHYGSNYVNPEPAVRAYLRTQSTLALSNGVTVDAVAFKAFCYLFQEKEGTEEEVDSLARIGKILDGKLFDLDQKHLRAAVELFEDLPSDDDEDSED